MINEQSMKGQAINPAYERFLLDKGFKKVDNKRYKYYITPGDNSKIDCWDFTTDPRGKFWAKRGDGTFVHDEELRRIPNYREFREYQKNVNGFNGPAPAGDRPESRPITHDKLPSKNGIDNNMCLGDNKALLIEVAEHYHQLSLLFMKLGGCI